MTGSVETVRNTEINKDQTVKILALLLLATVTALVGCKKEESAPNTPTPPTNAPTAPK